MSEGARTQDPPGQPPEPPQPVQAQPLVSDPEAQLILKQVVEQMGNPAPEQALRRSLQTILVMYQSTEQGGQPIIRYPKTKTEQRINLPRAGAR